MTEVQTWPVRARLSIPAIQAAVCQEFGILPLAMLSDRRARSVARPRQVAMYLVQKLTVHNLSSIGRAFRRDHTTVMHSIAVITRLIVEDELFGLQVAALSERLKFPGLVESY